MTTWHLYLVHCKDGSLYTGIATDVERRLQEHREGLIGAKYLRGKAPLKLVYEKEIGDRSLASKVEYRVKRLARSDKDRLLSEPALMESIIAECAEDRQSA